MLVINTIGNNTSQNGSYDNDDDVDCGRRGSKVGPLGRTLEKARRQQMVGTLASSVTRLYSTTTWSIKYNHYHQHKSCVQTPYNHKVTTSSTHKTINYLWEPLDLWNIVNFCTVCHQLLLATLKSVVKGLISGGTPYKRRIIRRELCLQCNLGISVQSCLYSFLGMCVSSKEDCAPSKTPL